MPKPSLNPDKARQGGGGIEAGQYEVIGSKFQNLKTDFRANSLYNVLTLQVLDAEFNPVRGADPIDLNLGFGEKSHESFHPGKGSSPDDADPQDMGDAVEVEGNTVWCVGGDTFNKGCGAMVFYESLCKLGFPRETMDRAWAPDLIGLKFSLASWDAKTCNEKLGLRLNTRPMQKVDRQGNKSEEMANFKVATKWANPTYLTQAKPASKPNGATSVEVPDTVEGIAALVLSKVARARAGTTVPSLSALNGIFVNQYTVAKMPAAKRADAQKLLKDEDWLIGAVADLNGVYEDGKVSFPSE